MRIAICDDIEEICNRIKCVLPKSTDNETIICFSNGYNLIDSMLTESYDIVYLDIEMPGVNGIETAQKLQTINHSVIIIFVSSYSCYVTNAFRVNAFQFLLKDNLTDDDIIFEYQRARERYKKEHFKYCVNQKSGVSYVPINKIVCIESANRHLYIIFSDGTFLEYRGKLDKEEIKLLPYNFIRTHESFLVNISLINMIKGDSLIMNTVSKEKIPISRKYKENVLNAYNLFNMGYMI